MKPSTVQINVNWSGFSEYCTSWMWMSREKNIEFCDVTLVCDNGEKLNAHQIILVNSSSVFKSILSSNTHPNPIVYLRGIKLTDLSSLLDFIYKGETSLQQNDLQQFLDLAGNLNIRGLNDKTIFDKSEKYRGTSLSSTSFETGSEQIDQDLFTIASESEENLGMEIKKLNKFKLSNISSDTFEKDVDDTPEKKQAFHNTEKHNKTPIPEKISDPLENRNFSCSLDKTYVETETLSMIEKLEIRGKGGTRKYKCKVCQKITKDKCDGMRHAEKHIDGLIYDCLMCDFSSVSKPSIHSHILIHEGISQRNPSETEKFLDSAGNLKIRGLNDETIFDSSEKYRETSLSSTSFKAGSEKSYHDLITIASESEDNLGMEIMQLNKFKLSNKSSVTFENDFDDTPDIKQALHNKEKHNKMPIPKETNDPLENRNFSCSLDKTYVETETLSMIEKLEMRGKRGKRTYKCNVCQKITKDKYDGMRHAEKHIDGLKYGCLMCDFSSVSRASICSHILKHEDISQKDPSETEKTTYLDEI